jgi:hypothetical protein
MSKRASMAAPSAASSMLRLNSAIKQLDF